MHNRDAIWVTEIGEEIKIKDLKTSHLENIIRFLKKNGSNKVEVTPGGGTTLTVPGPPYKSDLKMLEKEMRYRKLNRITHNPDYKDLF